MDGTTGKAGEKTSIYLLRTPSALYIEWPEEIYSGISEWRLVRDETFFRQVGHQLLHRSLISLAAINTLVQNSSDK